MFLKEFKLVIIKKQTQNLISGVISLGVIFLAKYFPKAVKM
jgi:hypothetical protein